MAEIIDFTPEDDDSTNLFAFVLAKDIKVTPKQFLIEGFLGRHEISAWFGAPDAGKSTVTIDAACHVAAGLCYCGHAVEQGTVLYVAAERGTIVKRRIKAWCLEHDLDDIPLAVVDDAVDLRSTKIDAERIIATANKLRSTLNQPIAWIIFDTFNRVLAGGDENSSKDVGAVITAVDIIHRATAAHCSLIHHVPVDRSDRMRGHGSVLGAVDATVRISKDNGVVQVETDIAKDLVDKPSFAFSFKSVTLITDDDGNATSAPVLVAAETPTPATTKKKAAPMPKAARIAQRALAEAIDELGAVPPASNHIPTNTRVVSFHQWRDYAYHRGISTSSEDEALRKAFTRASEYLIGENIVGAWNKQAWLAGPQ